VSAPATFTSLLLESLHGVLIRAAFLTIQVRAKDRLKELMREPSPLIGTGKAMKTPGALPAIQHQAGPFEEGEMVAHPTLGQTGKGHKLLHCKLFHGKEGKQPEPDGLRQELQRGLEIGQGSH